ncbi:Signal transduction histidine-protein kinase ArlS [Aquisphaera giovannonii]|uniref:histidine kinase n=1 Tax=Aquisphaera giovannonii TaxID=406548 RepID=A0A5B9W4F1_9BACT|nr:ATP-binding protein [Aquisphaera giovannonii]QEH35079.1 Signal transduction histidine-protein kinase ArlS [Aquisphaera giovannonii]
MKALPIGTRLTISFVAAMAAVLAGFSAGLYAMAARHLHRQADERLEAAIDTLTAAAEIGPEGVEWEPAERRLALGRRGPDGRLSWRVSDGLGGRIDGSATAEVDGFLARLGPSRRHPAEFTDAAGIPWRALARRLDRPRPAGEDATPVAPGRHEALVLAAAASMDGVRATLRALATTLAGLSLAIWTLALLTGRRLCRAALRPLTEMAASARAIDADEPGRRLPTPAADDELAELGRSFNALLGRLGESLERQRRFAGDASHQLRTPLTAIQGQVDLALRQDRPPEEYRRVLSVVQSRTRHLRQIVEGLLFLSRADAEARGPSLEEVALDGWLRAHLDAWPGPRRADVTLSIDAPVGGGSYRALVHPPLLGELLDNLLDNAAKYSPPGTPIRVRLWRRDGEVSFRVADAGPGIARAELGRVFEPFYRAEPARAGGHHGVGLGLSVAARIAAACGGRIRADSEPGRGATFTVDLPASDDAPDPEGPA